jgi:hypothetical protein
VPHGRNSERAWAYGATMSHPPPPSDIVPDAYDVALGDGWYPPEHHRATVFRWVHGTAQVNIAALRPVRHVLRLVVEPGPGVGLSPFVLTAEVDGEPIGSATVSAKQVVTFDLPPLTPRVFSVALSTDGGGRPSPNDPRVLDFRVFELSIERTADVFPAWAVPRGGFYPLERHAGTTFRWIGGEATVDVHGSHPEWLVFEAESGPGFGSASFALHVVAGDGTLLVTAEIASRTVVRVPLAASAHAATLTLRADGRSRPVPGDARTLNYRVFAAS